MYSYKLTNLQKELKNKERTINDVIRFIGTRNDHNPNYSLFLGAGCSVTSGIDSGSNLIEKWKKDVYLQENEGKVFDQSNADEFFQKEMWFDSRNPYSSLFEKKYDLPRQRRMFIEKEVRDKLPSIGYAYLIKLVESNYIKTLFTTNFDDLLNEAFYQYSNERPILCAHDSSINSITVTSKRPKIIKLHGDYLFDDIKSTLRETESLEENIKNKFIEFSKDYGLIVVGYGGNDRSIMDIITYLLKNEEYFKNGIYWCLRKDSEISEDLRKLLWKDRVYYVKIDGYDEFMAEIHSKLNDNRLPIDSSYLSDRKNEVINQLISNTYLRETSCQSIKEDFERLNKAKDKDIVTNFFQYLDQKEDKDERFMGFRQKKDASEELSDEEKELTKKINQELFTKNYLEVIDLINDKFKSIDKNRVLYSKLLNAKAKCLRYLNKQTEAIECYEELLEIDEEEINNYVILSQLKEDFEERVKYIEKAIEIEPYIDRLFYEKSKLLYNHYEAVYNTSDLEFDLNTVNKLIDKAIELSPVIGNPAWLLKVEIIEKINDDKEKTTNDVKKIISNLERQDFYHNNLIKLKTYFLNLENPENKETYELIEKSIPKQKRNEHKKDLEMMLLEQFKLKNDKDKLLSRFEFLEDKYELDNDYWEFKAKIQLEKFKSLNDAIYTLENITHKNKSNYSLLFDYLIYNEDFEKASNINKEHFEENNYNKAQILNGFGKYGEALELLRQEKNKSPFNSDLNVYEAFLLLKLGKYQEAYNFTQRCLKPSNHTEPYFLVNYFLAKKHFRNKEKPEKIREKLLKNKYEKSIIEVAGHCLIGDYKDVKTKLNSLLQIDYSFFYKIKDWPLFDDFSKSSYSMKVA